MILENKGGVFGYPEGDAITETPDGRTTVRNDCCFDNNLVNSPFTTTNGIAFSPFGVDLTKGMVQFRDED
jgi:hypothetical protein